MTAGCPSSVLKANVDTAQGGAAAGSNYVPIDFTNTSGSACTLDGYPGVSFVRGPSGGQLGWLHFGLGPSPAAEVRIRWPDGQVGPWQRVDANGFAIVDRAAAALRPWQPAP